MEIKVTDRAVEWFEGEMLLGEGDTVRFFVRYGGSSPLHEGFSLGMNKEEPMDPAVKFNKDGITFFIEERDLWFFQDHNLSVDVDDQTDGPIYSYDKG